MLSVFPLLTALIEPVAHVHVDLAALIDIPEQMDSFWLHKLHSPGEVPPQP
jgi:hypothetical protein